MTNDDIAAGLNGFDAVVRWFGRWPSFHDAEIVSLRLMREGESLLRVYPYYPEKPAAVDFVLEGVTDLELYDFSSQNVISSLDLEAVIDQTKEKAIRLKLGACYGLAGHIDARRVRVKLVPAKSSDDVSLH